MSVVSNTSKRSQTTSMSRRPKAWTFDMKDIKLLDMEDAPMVCTLRAEGVVEDDFGGDKLRALKMSKAVPKALLEVLKHHVRDFLKCSENPDPHHEFAKDNVKGMSRQTLLLKLSRAKVRPLGRTLAEYDLVSLRAAPVEWSGRILQFLPVPGRSGGIWRARAASINREGLLRMTTVEANPGELESSTWKCNYCSTFNEATELTCAKVGCGARRRGESRADTAKRQADEAALGEGNGGAVGDFMEVQLDAKNLCAVQAVPHSHGRSHCCVVTLNNLPHGTVMNSPAHHRGPGRIKSKDAPNTADDDNAFSGKDNGVTHSLIFSCSDNPAMRQLYAAFVNSTSATLPSVGRCSPWGGKGEGCASVNGVLACVLFPSRPFQPLLRAFVCATQVRRAAQRLDLATLKLLVAGYGVDPNRENAYGNTAIILATRATMSAYEAQRDPDHPEVSEPHGMG